MEIQRTAIEGVLILTPKRLHDDRGWFAETYARRTLAQAGVDQDFVQDNHSYTAHAGSVRGLHFQTEPFAQAKLVRCIRGACVDVIVDIRHGSPTFGRHVRIELSAGNGVMALAPIGTAHGFCTTAPDTEVTYKVSTYYSRDHDAGIFWNDPDLAIDWPVAAQAARLSARDAAAPRLADLPVLFRY